MKLTSLLVVLVAGLAVGVGALYLKLENHSTEFARLERDHAELLKTHADLQAAKASEAEAETEEIARLRKENEELLRLRNEVQQLRAEKKSLNQQVQSVQQQAQTAQQQALEAQARIQTQHVQVPGTNLIMSAAEAEMFRRRYGIAPSTAPATPEQQQQMACINNLRMIDGAMQQWALENKRAQGSPVGSADILPYLRGNALPACPAGGAYTIVSVGVPPICNHAGHKIGN